jgi:hypothetical protein
LKESSNQASWDKELMAGSNLDFKQLRSLDIRYKATTGLPTDGSIPFDEVSKDGAGVRILDGLNLDPDADGSILDFLIGSARKLFGFVGWLASGLFGAFSFTFSTVWSIFVSAVQFLWNFNWNATDQELDQSLSAYKTLLAGQLGATIGSALGFIVCGAAPGAVALSVNESLGLAILEEVGEEGLEEFATNIRFLSQTAARGLISAYIISNYKNARKNIKTFFKDPNSKQSQFAQKIFGVNFNKMVNAWGGQNSKPWSFALAVDDTLEKLPPFAQSFFEEVLEEFADACVEAGYIVANGLDDWAIRRKYAPDVVLGEDRAVEIQPNRQSEERLILTGKEEILKPQIVQALASYELVENRDVGMIIGESAIDYAQKIPTALQLRIYFNSVPKSPYKTSDGKRGKRTEIVIPNVSRSKLDWETIKNAAGGSNGYLWGRFLATAKLTEGCWMSVYGSSADEAKDRLLACLQLSDCELLTLDIREETKEGNRKLYNSLYKDPIRVYPIAFTLLNKQKVLNEQSGRAEASGVYQGREGLIFLNEIKQPPDYREVIQELLRTPGANN